MQEYHIANLVISLEAIGLLLNGLALYLIQRQGLYQIDMLLAFIMAVCDIILMTAKLMYHIVILKIGMFEVFTYQWFQQLDGVVTILLVSISSLAVGYLAWIRFWKIVLKRNINPTPCWILFVLHESVLVSFLLLVAAQGEFIPSPFERYYFPDALASTLSSRGCILVIITWLVFSAISIGISYSFIAYQYLGSIGQTPSLYYCPLVNRTNHLKKKVLALIRMLPLIITYDTILFLPIAIITKESITRTMRSDLEDCIFALSFLLLGLVNPLTLILLHEDTSKDLYDLVIKCLGYEKSKSNYV